MSLLLLSDSIAIQDISYTGICKATASANSSLATGQVIEILEGDSITTSGWLMDNIDYQTTHGWMWKYPPTLVSYINNRYTIIRLHPYRRNI